MSATARAAPGRADRGLTPLHGVRECPQCGMIQDMPEAHPGETIRCVRCNAFLRGLKHDPFGPALALAFASAMLFLIAISMPLMTLDVFGRTNTVGIFTGPGVLWRDADWLTAVGLLVGLASIAVPGVIISVDITLLLMARQPALPHWLPHLLKLRTHMRPWAMIEVYMLGIFVAYTKLVALAHVEIEPAIFALAGIMVLMIATDGAFDADALWERLPPTADASAEAEVAGDGSVHAAGAAGRTQDVPIHSIISCLSCGLVMEARDPEARHGHRCLRCEAVVHRRKPDSLARTVAWLAAALILYVPANVLPILTLHRFGSGGPSTIIAGVRELYASGELPLALLVFFASITVPCVKVLSLFYMVILTRFGSGFGLIDRTRLFRIIDFIGRWSMIDVFMVSILVAVVRFGFLSNVSADYGVVAFASVVILTIIALNAFDPRLMWDAAHRSSGAENAAPPSSSPRETAEA